MTIVIALPGHTVSTGPSQNGFFFHYQHLFTRLLGGHGCAGDACGTGGTVHKEHDA